MKYRTLSDQQSDDILREMAQECVQSIVSRGVDGIIVLYLDDEIGAVLNAVHKDSNISTEETIKTLRLAADFLEKQQFRDIPSINPDLN